VNTTTTAARLAVGTALLAGAAVLTVGPAFAGPVPEDPVSDGDSAEQAAPGSGGRWVPNESAYRYDSQGRSDGMSPQVKAHAEQIERALRDAAPESRPANNTSDSSDLSSVPVTLLGLLGGGIVAGAAGYTVYRFRHHGPVGAATA
jgi:hypothetical protein